MTEQSQKEPAPERQVFTFAQMLPTGVLWLINRTVFHPRGLALGLTVRHDEDAEHAEGWEIVASPDGTPYRYDDPDVEARKHLEVEQLFDLVRAHGVMPPPLTSTETEGATPINHDDAPWAPCCSRTDPHDHD